MVHLEVGVDAVFMSFIHRQVGTVLPSGINIVCCIDAGVDIESEFQVID
jgi:hypothetical protein